jgi:hypothetical protein
MVESAVAGSEFSSLEGRRFDAAEKGFYQPLSGPKASEDQENGSYPSWPGTGFQAFESEYPRRPPLAVVWVEEQSES